MTFHYHNKTYSITLHYIADCRLFNCTVLRISKCFSILKSFFNGICHEIALHYITLP